MSTPSVWNQRAFVAVGAVLSGLALPATGLLDHVSVSCLFVGFCTWHLVLNRRALLRYVRAAGGKTGTLRRLPARETVAAAAVVGGVLALTVAHALAEG